MVVVVFCVLCNAIFFALIVPRVEAARLDKTLTTVLDYARLQPETTVLVSKPHRVGFGRKSGLWKAVDSGARGPEFRGDRLKPVSGMARDKALDSVRIRMSKPDPRLEHANVWSGYSRLGKGTYCSAQTCLVTLAWADDTTYILVVSP